ncbi:MAG: hypothetical protein AAF579_01865 [Cyanobacteria bacterium P01_C01_bin.118]
MITWSCFLPPGELSPPEVFDVVEVYRLGLYRPHTCQYYTLDQEYRFLQTLLNTFL